ncbi:hypothetical protein [Dongia sp.]|uniref:hypothetical protein n=1 Tax=Dongia sp. TaxID=1977262 RepID=UPI0035B4E1A2
MTEETGKQAETPDLKEPELEELARRLLDLWQDQLGAIAANPDLAAQAARLMAAMPLPGMWLSQMGQMGDGANADLAKSWTKMSQAWMAQDWWKGASGGNGEAKTERSAPGFPPGTTPGAAAAAAASEPRGGDLDELSHRLAGIERRLEQLAEQSAERKRKPAAKPKSAAGSARPARKPRRPHAADPEGGSGGTDGGAAG